jgi:Domain of unknown function (DUF202)
MTGPTGTGPTGTAPTGTGPTGTAPRRTRLAWRRTALATGAVTVLTGRLALAGGHHPGHLIMGGLALLGWAGLVLLAGHRAGRVAPQTPPPGWVPTAMALGVAWFAVLGAVLVVLP